MILIYDQPIKDNPDPQQENTVFLENSRSHPAKKIKEPGDVSRLMPKSGSSSDDIKALKRKIKSLEEHLEDLEKDRWKLSLEVQKLNETIRKMAIPPMLVGTVSRIVSKRYVVVRTPNGQEFLVGRSFDVKLGDNVALNQQTLAIVKVLKPDIDVYVAAMELDDKPTETYADIGGLADCLQQVREVMELPLTNPGVFDKMGIEAPAGILLEGPPGTGKTLVARAVANATHATFIRLVGSELIQKFIGEGARIVRELFKLARQRKPALVFIDEIDAVASRRTPDSQVSDREVQRTLMQLLAEMDGFNQTEGIKIVAATNRPDILDPAILRPGRFDRIIHFEFPSPGDLVEIFKIHTRRMPVADDLNYKELANLCHRAQMTGAHIKAICTEAGMFTIRAGKDRVERDEFYQAIRKIQADLKIKLAAEVYS